MHTLTLEHREFIDYQLHLPGFEGPFDVLLRLVDRHQLPITDVSLHLVTQQFLDHVAQIGGAPAEVIAEFTTVGSRLVQLKARSLLPRPPAPDSEVAPDELIVQLMEYRKVKEAAQRLAAIDTLGQFTFTRGEASVALPASTGESKLAQHHPMMLAKALKRRLTVVGSVAQVVPKARATSLRELSERIVGHLRSGPILFDQIAREAQSKHEIKASFLTLLLLVRHRVVYAEQSEPFGAITINLTEPLIDASTVTDSVREFDE